MATANLGDPRLIQDPEDFIPNADTSWSTHELWRRFDGVIGTGLSKNLTDVLPSAVIYANRIAKNARAVSAGMKFDGEWVRRSPH